MPHFWLNIAIALYGFGLAYSLYTLHGRREGLEPFIITMVRIGGLFHFVSLAESVWDTRSLSLLIAQRTESLLAFLLMVLFFFTYWRHRSFSHGIFVFPLVFALTLFTALGHHPLELGAGLLRSGWFFAHIALILVGYAALFFTFSSSILYLVQERSLKSHSLEGISSRLPALQVIDDIGFRSLLVGFPFMTLGMLAGAAIAQAAYGPGYLRDPKIVLSLIMWAVYMMLLFTRWTAGWRGRRAALLSTIAFTAATLAWVANYFTTVHRVSP